MLRERCPLASCAVICVAHLAFFNVMLSIFVDANIMEVCLPAVLEVSNREMLRERDADMLCRIFCSSSVIFVFISRRLCCKLLVTRTGAGAGAGAGGAGRGAACR